VGGSGQKKTRGERAGTPVCDQRVSVRCRDERLGSGFEGGFYRK